ncbi:helix-turn-helix domain-containing protein [Staphylospora marina]|uniref:helix-turn-helix domain-containing protein n=1 Tax=Staphylospora marina TaxID=2490858 RepID=UPI000F5C1F7C|nr:helix-turn-helix transcriptional regulator [Staphylospora marina]
MIRTEREYRQAKERVAQHEKLLEEQTKTLESMGLTEEEIERALSPARFFGQKLRLEVEEYERYRRGDFDMTCTFDNIGRQLVAFRIFRGISQAELARRLGVTPPQVSRDERNEYGGASMEKVKQVLRALEMDVILVPSEGRRAAGS